MNPQFEIGDAEEMAGMSEYSQDDFEMTRSERLKEKFMFYFDKLIESLKEAKNDIENV